MNKRNLMQRKQNLRQRLLFVLWAAPLGWIIVNINTSLVPPSVAQHLFGIPSAPIFPGHLVVVAIVFLACAEYLRMLSVKFAHNGFWLAYLWLAGQVAGQLLPPNAFGALDAFGKFDMYILLLIVGAEAIVWGRQSSRWMRASLLFSGLVFLSYASYSLMNFYRPPFTKVFPPHSPMLVSQLGIVTVLASIFMCDTAAYFVGTLWGKHHFTNVSPHKTIEGSVAGLVTAAIVSTVGWCLFADPVYPAWLGTVLGLLIGFMGQAGDLLVSLMKRYFRVKDASNLIPGHGGVLDRFDSLFFTAPILNLFFIIVARTW